MMWIQVDKRSLLFMLTSIGSKGLAAVAQLYAIFVFTRMHTRDDAAVIFLLLGYAIWFQVFELGLAQTLQNKFNAKLVSSSDMLKTLIVQFFFMWAVALIVVTTPLLTDLLLPDSRKGMGGEAVVAFSIGAAILLIASNNAITQRLLLVFNQGQLGNTLILSQSLLAIVGLASYDFIGQPNLTVAVLLYLGPQVLVYLPVLVSLMIRLAGSRSRQHKSSVGSILADFLGFWGLGVLSALYLGLDYYFAAHYLSGEQVVSYHLATRVFFISYVAYYAFVQHRARHLSFLSEGSEVRAVSSIFKDSVVIGLGSVLTVYCLAIALERLGTFDSMTNGVGINFTLLFFAFLYFMVRVCRDVALVIAGGLNARKALYLVYLLELTVGLSVMPLIVPIYGGIGIFASMSLASTLGLFLLLHQAKKLGYQY